MSSRREEKTWGSSHEYNTHKERVSFKVPLNGYIFLNEKNHIKIVYLKLFDEKKVKNSPSQLFFGYFWIWGVPFVISYFVTWSILVNK